MNSSNDSEKITNRDLLLYILYKCGGADGFVNTEDFCEQVMQYVEGKQRFKWAKYDYPDKERITRELREMKGTRKGIPLVKGGTNIGALKGRRDGWMLTELGINYLKEIEQIVEKALSQSRGNYHRYDAAAIRQRITTTTCYKIYEKDVTLRRATKRDFTNMLRCLPDASREKIKANFQELVIKAKAVEATDLVEFLDIVRDYFKKFLT